MTFIENVLLDLKSKAISFDTIHFIIPNKRAGLYINQYLSKLSDTPIFAPNISSIEEFVEHVSGLKKANNILLLLKLYDSYKAMTPKQEIESFEKFSKWGQLVLQDFNEIDRFLINETKLFEYLKAIQDINHWALQADKSKVISSYLNFWNNLLPFYKHYKKGLISEGIGYQGLLYRKAVKHLERFVKTNLSSVFFVFLGFNALNTAESFIVQKLLKLNLAIIYWDIDSHFLNDNIHSVGHFIRRYKTTWPYYKTKPLNFLSSVYTNEKNITTVGVPKRVGQAKYIGNLLSKFMAEGKDLSNTAVVLGDETLIFPLLNSIPTEVPHINITMGLPLHTIPLAILFEYLFDFHNSTSESIYYKAVFKIINHASVQVLCYGNQFNLATKISKHIHSNNVIYLTLKELEDLAGVHFKWLIHLLFKKWTTVEKALSNCETLIFKIKEILTSRQKNYDLDLEFLHRFYKIFNQISLFNSSHNHIQSIGALAIIYKELLHSETLDFKGEPLRGLQIMGMLETRVLDFETVIISDVNEGILPAGKTQNSFIPFDVKIENGLPTFKEKDAIYTYHFYRLIQRAKKVYLLYNTEVDVLKGGEKSRFITQLDVEGIHAIKHHIASPLLKPLQEKTISIIKTDSVLSSIEALAKSGFSPSSLASYIRNPIDFYYEKILGVKPKDTVEEEVAANTLGSVIHYTLEDFYKPLEGQELSVAYLETMKPKIRDTVRFHFKKLYRKGDMTQGKNRIIFEITIRYIQNFINHEINTIKAGNRIRIIGIETKISVDIPIETLPFSVKLKGTVDRIDQYNGTTRIIDYKSGKVTQANLDIVEWETIIADYDKHSKAFQLLCYAYMTQIINATQPTIEAGIFSFKNLNAGCLRFAKKETSKGKRDFNITTDTIVAFEDQLKILITEICNPKLNFEKKELNL